MIPNHLVVGIEFTVNPWLTVVETVATNSVVGWLYSRLEQAAVPAH